MTQPETDNPRLWGLVVTYKRAAALDHLLSQVSSQSRPPDRLVVVDNGSDPSARAAALRAGATYLDAMENLGPAGGIALGMQYVLDRANGCDWIVLFDDDDPPNSQRVLEELWLFAQERKSTDPATAAVGLVGARYNRATGIFQRVPDSQLTGAVCVDYLGGGQLPMYNCERISEVGVFERAFFFGFEEAEYGLRLRRAGSTLWVNGEMWLEQRRLKGRLNLKPADLRTPLNTTAWRRYYAVRNLILIARRYGEPLTPIYVAATRAVKSAVALAIRRRSLHEVTLPLRGAIHGLTGRAGRTVDPGSARKTY